MASWDVMEREAPPLDALFAAKRSFGYGGVELDRGQVFQLRGLPNDRLLYGLGYVMQVAPKATTYPCRVCGCAFIDMGLRDGHGRARHELKPFVPPPPPERRPEESRDAYQNRLDEWAKAAGVASDASLDAKDKLEDEVAPLDLTKTKASRK